MSIDELTKRVHERWTEELALSCWTAFYQKYDLKHHGACFEAIKGGNVNLYIDREGKVFERYARMWAYKNGMNH